MAFEHIFFFFLTFYFVLGYSFPGGSVVKDPPAKQEMQVRFLGGEIPQTGAWQATVPGVTRVRNNWATKPPPPPPQLINNTGTVPGGQQRGSAVHMHVSVLPQTPFPSRLPHNIDQRSMCYRRSLLVMHFKYRSVYLSIPSSLTSFSPHPPPTHNHKGIWTNFKGGEEADYKALGPRSFPGRGYSRCKGGIFSAVYGAGCARGDS